MPFYKGLHFDTVEEFNDYITADDYGSNSNKGICVAISVKNDVPNNYDMTIHMNDHRIGVSKYSYAQGIPLQQNPVWLPQTASPDLLSYVRYQHNGFSFLQNFLAQ